MISNQFKLSSGGYTPRKEVTESQPSIINYLNEKLRFLEIENKNVN